MAKFKTSLGFDIDTTKADKSLKQLYERLTELSRKGTVLGVKIDDADINSYMNKLKKVYDTLETYYKKKQFKVDTGVSDMKDKRAIEEAVEQFDDLNIRLGSNKLQANEVIKVNNKLSESLQKTTKSLSPLDKAMQQVTKSFQAMVMFGIAQTGFRSITDTINTSIQFVKELDSALTDIRIVTGATTSELKQYAQDYNEMARELGRSTVEIAQAANEFYRQGKNQAEAMDMLRGTMIAAKIAGTDMETATKTLTTTLNGFQMTASDTMSVIDKFATLD